MNSTDANLPYLSVDTHPSQLESSKSGTPELREPPLSLQNELRMPMPLTFTDQQLIYAKGEISRAPVNYDDTDLFAPLFLNVSVFKRWCFEEPSLYTTLLIGFVCQMSTSFDCWYMDHLTTNKRRLPSYKNIIPVLQYLDLHVSPIYVLLLENKICLQNELFLGCLHNQLHQMEVEKY